MAPFLFARKTLDAEVVGTPALDAGFDLLLGEFFADGAFGEGGEFGVGGEAQANELALGESVGGSVWNAKRGEAQALFKANDAVLRAE